MNVRLLAQMLVRAAATAKVRPYRHVHQVADRFVGTFRRTVLGAFNTSKNTLNRTALIAALTNQDEQAVLVAVSDAITAFEDAAQAPIEALLKTVRDTSAKVAARRLLIESVKAALRTAAPKPPPRKGLESFAFDETNPAAVEWTKTQSARLISGVSKTTREGIRHEVESAFEEQFDVNELADRIGDLLGNADRAMTIARTETMLASNEGQQALWDQAVEASVLDPDSKKEWIVTPDDKLCPICEPLDGVQVGLDEDFDVDGVPLPGPPAHPNCRCTVGLA